MKYHITLLSVIFFLLTFPVSGFGIMQSSDLKVRLAIDERKSSKNKDSVIEAKIYVSNISEQSVLVVEDEPIRLSYNVKKRELGLSLDRDYGKYNYGIPRLKLLRPNGNLVMKRYVPASLFAEISEGKYYLNSVIGYIVENNFEKIGITPKFLRKKKSQDKIKIYSIFDPTAFAEIQCLEISDEVEIDLKEPEK